MMARNLSATLSALYISQVAAVYRIKLSDQTGTFQILTACHNKFSIELLSTAKLKSSRITIFSIISIPSPTKKLNRMDFSVRYPFIPMLHSSEQIQQQKQHDVHALTHHRENVAKIDAVVFALATGDKTMWEMRRIVETPMAVLNKQIGWFGMHGFHCLRYLGHPAKEIFGYIAGGFQALEPGLSNNAARRQVVQIHKLLAGLAAGGALLEIAHSRRWTKEDDFKTLNLRMALYCLHVSECIQQLGIRRSTLLDIMAHVQMGIPLKHAFLELGMPEALLSAGSLLTACEYPGIAPDEVFHGYPGFAGGSDLGCDFYSEADFSSEYGSSYFGSEYSSTSESEYSYTTEDSLSTEITDFSSEYHYHQVQFSTGGIDTTQCDYDDETRAFYEWKFYMEAIQCFEERGEILQCEAEAYSEAKFGQEARQAFEEQRVEIAAHLREMRVSEGKMSMSSN